MTGELSENFHGVGIGPLSKILAFKYLLTTQFLTAEKVIFSMCMKLLFKYLGYSVW